jgi:hypothetical protein
MYIPIDSWDYPSGASLGGICMQYIYAIEDKWGYRGEWEPNVIESDDGINAEKTRQPTYPHYLD